MQSQPPHGVSPHGMSDSVLADEESIDPVIERLLAERAQSHRAPEELVGRVVRATAPAILPPIYSVRASSAHRGESVLHAARSQNSIAGRADVVVARLRRFAVAASLALLAGVVVVSVFTDRALRDTTADSTQLASVPDPSAGLTASEPVLVSLLAGSEVDPAGADEHPAEAILRMRDASFAELQGEVLLVVSAGVGTR